MTGELGLGVTLAGNPWDGTGEPNLTVACSRSPGVVERGPGDGARGWILEALESADGSGGILEVDGRQRRGEGD